MVLVDKMTNLIQNRLNIISCLEGKCDNININHLTSMGIVLTESIKENRNRGMKDQNLD